jgi:hypothetical protein
VETCGARTGVPPRAVTSSAISVTWRWCSRRNWRSLRLRASVESASIATWYEAIASWSSWSRSLSADTIAASFFAIVSPGFAGVDGVDDCKPVAAPRGIRARLADFSGRRGR